MTQTQSVGQAKYYNLTAAGSNADYSEGYENSIIICLPVGFAGGASYAVETTNPSAADPCLPDTTSWAPVVLTPECDDPANVVATNWVIPLLAADAGKCIEVAAPICGHDSFIRVVATGTVTDVNVTLRIGRLRRTGV